MFNDWQYAFTENILFLFSLDNAIYLNFGINVAMP